MEEKNSTDEEIVKDIERSTGMPSYWKKTVLDLINRQKAEIERLKDENCHDYHCMCLAQQEKAELQKQVDELTRYKDAWKRQYIRKLKECNQAVKDTAERFASLVEFHSVATMKDGVEYFTISALGLKEILSEDFNVKDEVKPDQPVVTESTLSETIAMEGPYKFKRIIYIPTCRYGCDDCIHDPAYIKATYPDWYAELYGKQSPEEAAKDPRGCAACSDANGYDDEDK
jgi:hypothetical protein